ncbi:MAG TPA: AAA family ATPase [Ktedonobacterales bacterium]
MLKRYRRAAGLTQEQLAERAGYSVGHISKLESAVRHPVAATVELLAEALALGDAEQTVLRRAARSPAMPLRAASLPTTETAPRLIGRVAEMEWIEQHLANQSPPLLVLCGETGIGTSRLLAEAPARGTASGWRVLEAACRRTASSPFDPLLAALAGAVSGLEPSQLHTALRGCSWLARLLPELAESGAVPMPAWALPADQERRLMFDAVARFLGNVAGPAGTLLVLDNLQWARADALDLLSALVQGSARSFLNVIAACRPSALQSPSPLATLVADMAAERLVALEHIKPLASDAAGDLFDSVVAGAGPIAAEVRAEALRKSGGVPFALVSYARWLREEGDAVPGDATHLGVPWDLAHLVRQRVAALPEAARTIVRIAALADGDDPRALLLAVAQRLGYHETDAVRGLDAACVAELLVERGDQHYAFAQNVVQEVVEHDVGAAQRAQMHHEIAEVLAQHHGGTEPEWLAAHFIEAGESDAASVYLQQAGTRANALHAYAAAEQCYRALADEHEHGAEAWQAAHAHEQLGIALAQQGRYTEAVTAFERAAQAYRAAGNQDGAGRAVARLGWGHLLRGDVAEGVARLEREAADPRGLNDRGRALLYLTLARLYDAAGNPARQLASAEQAVVCARLTREAQLLALAETERSAALDMAGQREEGLRVLEDTAIPLQAAAGDLWSQTLALDRAAHSHLARGEFARAETCITQGLALARQVDDTYLVAVLTHVRGILRYHSGAWRRARIDLFEAVVVLRASGMPSRAVRAAVWFARLELARGNRERAIEDLHRAIALAERIGDMPALVEAHCALAEQALVAGHAEEARTLLLPLLAHSRYREADVSEALALLGWAALELGDAQQDMDFIAASVVQAAGQRLRCRLVDALRIRARLAGREQRWDAASASFEEALELARALPLPYAEAKVRSDYGQVLWQCGAHERAEEQYVAARRLLEQLGERLYALPLERALAECAAASA